MDFIEQLPSSNGFTVDSLITHTPYDINTSSPVWIGQKYIVYEITSTYGAIRWPTSYNNMCGRQKDMLVFMGMGYKGVDCTSILIIMDRLLKQGIFILTHDTITSPELASSTHSEKHSE